MRKLIIKIFHFNLMQHRWGRKYIGGKFYYLQTDDSMPAFWFDTEFSECESFCIQKETYPEWVPKESRCDDYDFLTLKDLAIPIICIVGALIASLVSITYIVSKFLKDIL